MLLPLIKYQNLQHRNLWSADSGTFFSVLVDQAGKNCSRLSWGCKVNVSEVTILYGQLLSGLIELHVV